MKKLISVFLSLAMILAVAVSASAAPPETDYKEPIEVIPRYSFTNNTKTITSSDIVDGVEVIICHGSVNGYRGITTKIIIDLELQQLVNDEWQTINSWSTTVNSHRASLEKNQEVPSGTYRTFATYTVFGGEQCEIIGSSSLSYEIM